MYRCNTLHPTSLNTYRQLPRQSMINLNPIFHQLPHHAMMSPPIPLNSERMMTRITKTNISGIPHLAAQIVITFVWRIKP